MFLASLEAQVVEGHVVSAATGAGIAAVGVSLFQDGKSLYSGVGDAQGYFRIEGVKDGVYSVRYKAEGFFPIPSPLDGSGVVPFSVTGGAAVVPESRMQPVGKISGRVIDPAGEPVGAALVFLRWENALCKMPLCVGFARTVQADKNGEYSIADLDAPGRWIVSAAAPLFAKAPEPRDGERLGWVQTFYPGVTDGELAARVTTGSEITADIKLATVPVHRVRGTVLDVRGDPVAGAAVTLGKGSSSSFQRRTSMADGTFEFESVADGDWRISTMVSGLWANEEVRVKGRDVEDLALRLAAAFTIHGKIVMEVPEGAPAPKAPVVSMAMNTGAAAMDTPKGFLFGVPEGKDGFTVQGVYPGPYMILPGEPPAGYYVDSIRVGEREALEPDVQIATGFEAVTVVYKLGGGTVRGACGGGTVVLIPKDIPLRRPGFIRRTVCGRNGFEIPAVRPGEYYGLAMAGNPALLDDGVLKQAAGVTVRGNESTTVEMKF